MRVISAPAINETSLNLSGLDVNEQIDKCATNNRKKNKCNTRLEREEEEVIISEQSGPTYRSRNTIIHIQYSESGHRVYVNEKIRMEEAKSAVNKV